MVLKDIFSHKTRVKLDVVKDSEAVTDRFAEIMISAIKENNRSGKPSTFILPVGPTGQYQKIADLCNAEKINLSNMFTFHMDEYLDKDGKVVSDNHPMNFKSFILNKFLGKLDPTLNMSADRMFFPTTENLDRLPREIEKIGGIDICFAGIGIDGHLAFNEPEPEMSPEEFAKLSYRKIAIAKETIVCNSIASLGGDMDAMPKHAVTIGMKEILASRKIHCFLNWPWQKAVIRKILFHKPTADFPATLLQLHADVTITMAEYVAEPLKAEPI